MNKSIDNMPITPTLATITQQLSDKGYSVNTDVLLNKHPTSNVAWYQHLLLALGVCAAFVCFILLLLVSDFFDQGHMAQSIWAVGFVAVAILLYRNVVGKQPRGNTLSTIFATQVSFVLIIAGQGLLLFHLYAYFHLTHVWQLTLLTGVIVAVTFPLYPLILSRIISTSVFLFLSLFALPFMMSPMFFAVLIGIVGLSLSVRLSTWRYLRYACILVIILRLTLPLTLLNGIDSILFSQQYRQTSQFDLYFPSLMIAVVLGACVVYLADKQRGSYGVWLLCIALLILAYFLPPTLFFALLLMVLGYATHDNVITGLGLLMMPYYLFKYYYDLQWSLLDKSLLLMASGVILLVVAFAVAKLPNQTNKRAKQ